ncbi:MAG: polyprenyl synthetase family protein [Legionella sp.]
MNNRNLNHYYARHEQILARLVHEQPIPSPKLKEAILYALFPGGKRLRPMLVYLCGELLATDIHHLDIIAASIEITHCYSLIHDDLPAMDNDDIRRGKASCHRAFDEATAILAGDGMQALAIQLLLTHLSSNLSAEKKLAIIYELVNASGTAGMVSGQSLDLVELGQETMVSEHRLIEIHQLKTGQLISACINMVIQASDVEGETVNVLQKFGNDLGLLFQMQDDYLDRYSIDKLGKGRSSDLANQKLTFADRHTRQQLHELIHQHYQQMRLSLQLFKSGANNLLSLLDELQQLIP